jgi:hypothetical protein
MKELVCSSVKCKAMCNNVSMGNIRYLNIFLKCYDFKCVLCEYSHTNTLSTVSCISNESVTILLTDFLVQWIATN